VGILISVYCGHSNICILWAFSGVLGFALCAISSVKWQGRNFLCLPLGLTLRTAKCCTQLRKHLVWITQQTSVVSLNSLKRMLSVIVLECVYCEVRTEYTCVTYTRSFLTGDPCSIPCQDVWVILCPKWHWTAIFLFFPSQCDSTNARCPPSYWYSCCCLKNKRKKPASRQQSNDFASGGQTRITFFPFLFQNVGFLVG